MSQMPPVLWVKGSPWHWLLSGSPSHLQSMGVAKSPGDISLQGAGFPLGCTISFRMDWLDLLAVQGTLKSLLQHHSSKAWGREESDTTKRLHFHFLLSCIGEGNGNPLQRKDPRVPHTPSLGFSGKNTGVGCHFLLQHMKVKSESEVA